MENYDIVFMGHLATATIVPFHGPTFIERGGPAFFGPLAASCLDKKIAAITRIGRTEQDLLDPLRRAGIALFLEDRETTRLRVIHPSANVDERQVFIVKHGGHFSISDIPRVEPCLIHLGGLSHQEFSLELLHALKTLGFTLSVDMQSFVWQVEAETGSISLSDMPGKKEMLRLVDFVKADIVEGETLTGARNLQDQARILEDLGSRETVITCSDGALARSDGKT